MAAFTTLDEVKAANVAIGHHWFSPSTMSFFDSRIETPLMDGRYFVSSEVPPSGKRVFNVRVTDDEGRIDTVGEHDAHATLADALAVVKALCSAVADA